MAAKVSVGHFAADEVSPTSIPNHVPTAKPSTRRSASVESGTKKMFMEPSLREMAVGLAEVVQQMEAHSSGQKIDEIVHKLEAIIIQADLDSKLAVTPTPILDKAAQVAMLGQSIAAYCNTIDPAHLRKLTTRVISDTTLWLSRIFRFDDSSAFFHSDSRDGLLRVCRLALSSKYDKYGTDGFNALYTKPPIIYISAGARPGLGQYICTQLGLPLSSLCTVPCNTVFGSQHTMDIATLERLIKDDEGSSKIPLMVVANAGTPLAGHTDNLNRLRTICDEYGVWLHVEGHNLATLALGTVPTSVLAAKRVNSLTLQPGVWLGLPGVTSVTLYKTADPAMSLAAGVGPSQLHDRLSALPLWLSLQSLGHNGVVAKLKYAADLSQHMQQRLNSLGSINLSPGKGSSQGTIEGSLKEIFTKTIQVLAQADVVSTVVVFKYGDRREGPDPDDGSYTEAAEDRPVSSLPAPLLDAFNSWLGSELNRQNLGVPVDVVNLDKDGVCLRFSPLQSASYRGTTADDIDNFMESLKILIEHLNFTCEHRLEFQEAVESRENLLFVDMVSHGGLGVIQFIPEYLNASKNKETTAKELDKINAEIVQRLQAGENGSSICQVQTGGGTKAIGVGVVTEGVSIDDVVDLVWSTGKELEDSSKFLDSMADVVLKGIEDAQRELVKENENRLMEEGVFRQVPIVSSLLNWFSPPPKEATIKGRSLNLTSGALESTETTYKLHMQVQKESGVTPTRKTAPRKTPSTPTTPLTPNSTPQGSHFGEGEPEEVEGEGEEEGEGETQRRVQKRDLEELQPQAGLEGTGSSSSTATTTSNSSFQEVTQADVSESIVENEDEENLK
ncbi:putative pyridoxal-dependent decarboxylase domain-containing protein 2 isoform X1 [Patiria miniata]|uniref:Pyridoxal-dependent decarboxylase domain-containing protein 1 n=1 Tax=Patiria miniata TaxID=46514 RepID=A0A914AUS5_PATMI|nr:putative pyridoxal-dependent decarboxylase domain-containing protein 2 isoform X1 [Patiria miniata]